MRAAFAAIRHGAWLRGAPVVERVGPLLRAAHVVQLDARVDDAAVDDAGDDRHQLAGSDGDHHLVEERQAVGCLSEANQRTAAALAREVHDIDVAEPFADVLDIGEGRHRAGEITAGDLLEGVRQQDVAALDAVVLILIEQTGGRGQSSRTRASARRLPPARTPPRMRSAPHATPRRCDRYRLCARVKRSIASGSRPARWAAIASRSSASASSARSRERRRLGHSVTAGYRRGEHTTNVAHRFYTPWRGPGVLRAFHHVVHVEHVGIWGKIRHAALDLQKKFYMPYVFNVV
jgi:hypothetical protein